MCGRYTLTKDGRQVREELAGFFSETRLPPPIRPGYREWFEDMRPRYNIAPTQDVVALLLRDGDREAALLRWGLIPSWARDPRPKPFINARGETVAERPSFRNAFRRRHCLLPADGWFEWRQEGKTSKPFYFRLGSGDLFGLAGLWEVWRSPDGTEVATCAVVTTAANELVAPIHDRMPVMLTGADLELWLDPSADAEALHAVMRPFSAEPMESYAVRNTVNRALNDGPECIEPIRE